LKKIFTAQLEINFFEHGAGRQQIFSIMTKFGGKKSEYGKGRRVKKPSMATLGS